ncbi:NAD(P)-dependent oxidoreductase [Granulicella sp. dw_53]|uniref:NAD(P)-dependent oxidoreductase n=1 Tax=Granulicella sp. dw_53 TaxID=2719792 RepID=UPI001BD31C13|nr:NAD(P)-dependent oxidoreductase [Granulicella sp. dw_53]
MRVAFLGLGQMGSAVARHLMKAGHELTVWNRTAAHAEPLKREGAKVAASASDAVAGCEVIFTMVTDDAALEEVLFRGGVMEAIAEGSTHVSLSTISVALSKRVTEEHRLRQQHFVGAPVFGRPVFAEQGQLWTVLGGAKDQVEKVRPLVETFSRGFTVVSEQPWSAHAMKLGGNFMIAAVVASLSEGMIYAESMQIEPAVFVETVNNALIRSPFYEAYGKLMLHPPEVVGGTVTLLAKDTRLFREAAKDGHVQTPLADVFHARWEEAIEAGMQDRDFAPAYYEVSQRLLKDKA